MNGAEGSKRLWCANLNAKISGKRIVTRQPLKNGCNNFCLTELMASCVFRLNIIWTPFLLFGGVLGYLVARAAKIAEWFSDNWIT